MPPNPSKCKVLHAGNNNPGCRYEMTIEDQVTELETTQLERDLGVHVDETLSFDQHVNLVTTKCNKLLGLIKSTITTRSPDVIKKLYTALIRPHLEYCGSAVILKRKYKRKKLEGVQRRATKMVSSIRHLQYGERLQALRLPSLQYRRKRGDAIQVYKYLNGISHGNTDKLLPLANNKRTRGHRFKLKKRVCRTEIRRCSFAERVVNPWNGLKRQTVEAKTLNSFKNMLDKEWILEAYEYE